MVRRRFLWLAGAFLAAGLSGATIRSAEADDRAALLRARPLTDADGATTTLAAWDGQIVVVNFWASWCAPCRRELPQLDRWNADWSPRGAHVVAVSLDGDRERAQRFVADQELKLTVLHDGPEGLARQLDLPAVPTTYVLDRDGTVILEVQGSGERELKCVRETVEKLLASRMAEVTS